jgi:hypothetical protein
MVSEDKLGSCWSGGIERSRACGVCRSKGLFVEQVVAWREACQQANAAPAERHRDLLEQGRNDRKEIKQLKKDLTRKEKALAEAAALIILRKKAQAIWGEPEDD